VPEIAIRFIAEEKSRPRRGHGFNQKDQED
jgi:hypothetical protein